MGCFNTVIIECPHCGEDNEEQTKNGSCTLSTYLLKDAPIEDLIGVSGYPIMCLECDGEFIVRNKIITNTFVETYVDEKKDVEDERF